MGKTSGIASDNTNACSTISATGYLLHFSVVQTSRSRPLVLYVNFRKFSTSTATLGEHSGNDVWLNEWRIGA
jgi:hypothetical protein